MTPNDDPLLTADNHRQPLFGPWVLLKTIIEL
jgi:hypothetical protein